jgi:hypothetical protein
MRHEFEFLPYRSVQSCRPSPLFSLYRNRSSSMSMHHRSHDIHVDLDVEHTLDDVWLPKSDIIQLRLGSGGGAGGCQVELVLRSGADALYEYYPFSVWVFAKGAAQAIAEFDGPLQERRVCFRADAPTKYIALRVETELGAIPKNVGLGLDVRETAVGLSRILVRPLGLKPKTHRLLGCAPNSLSLRPFPSTPPNREESRSQLKYLGPSINSPEPIFVVGSYRSATSALTWAIGQHPDVFPLDETNWLGPLALGAAGAFRMASIADRNMPATFDIDENEFLGVIANAIDDLCKRSTHQRQLSDLLKRASDKDPGYDPRFRRLRSRFSPKRRWVDGTPEYSGYIPLIAKLFPKAKFIALLRDPHLVVRSLLNFDAPVAESMTSDKALAIWEYMTRRCVEGAAMLGLERMRIVATEELVKDPVKTMAAVWRFLSLPDFGPAAGVFDVRVNSSFAGDNPSSSPEILSPRHAEIYTRLLAGEPFDALPWESTFSTDASHIDTLLKRSLAILTD